METREKILNVFRICHLHGHDELIVTSRFSDLLRREVTSIFRDVLKESTDADGAFRRVVFALPQAEIPAKISLALKQEFWDTSPEGRDGSIPQGQYTLQGVGISLHFFF